MMKKFEWAVVGSGIAGIVASEILTREGHSVLLIEKNEKLAAETTRDFHEWLHLGSLYTLIPDNLMTLKYVLGAIDDLLEYYNPYENMNLVATEKGLKINHQKNGWFEDNHIHFKFRIKNRKWAFPWLIGVARSMFLIDRIKEHDWLRRRAGVKDPFKYNYRILFSLFKKLVTHPDKFYDYTTPDITINSRSLLHDLVTYSQNNGLKISTNNEFLSFEKKEGKIIVHCAKGDYEVDKLLLGISGNITKFVESSMKVSYAPLAVIKNVLPSTNSFVELDYFPENCINIITKKNGIGLIGGISFPNLKKCESYLKEVIEKHKEYNPTLEVLHTYNGIKSEITLKNQPRNYLYHIFELENNVWGIIPGKFTLGFSIAPEFYRRVYKRNPKKNMRSYKSNGSSSKIMSNTVWYDVYLKNKHTGIK